ncbi:hypothetical protein AX018_104112 [Paracidovorax anthurii]|uniref:Uncharacterized protein n=1 Tax=Paracidovorax anthurii TaxID=78229 RepID=A0A328YU60_9BURK|nr:hypothetical protein [Paracidovorax anthurii]RAR76954.1 hypothetical protein AX018_104112 [Paracidovorax anthurii]
MKRLSCRMAWSRWWMVPAALLWAQGALCAADVPTDVAFGRSPMPGYLGRVLQPVVAGDPLLPGAFDLQAQLALRHVPAMELESSVPLEVSVPGTRAAAAGQGVRLAAPADTDLSAYDEVWVDHAAPGHCSAHLELQTDEGLQEGRPSSSTIVGMADGKSVLFTEQPYRMPWVAKDMFYLLARQFGSSDDRRWRYAQDGDATVLQRRLQVPLDRAQAIELELPAGARVKGVNLLISVGDHHRPSRLLTMGDFTSESLDDGVRTRFRLRVDRVLAEYRQAKRPVSLAELVVFYQGPRERTLAEKPLRRLSIFSLPGTGLAPVSGRALQVPMKTGPLTASTWRTVLDLKDVTGRWVARMPLRAAEWKAIGGPACGLEPYAARLVKLKRSRTPAYVAETAALVRALGGPFVVQPEDRTAIEWLDIVAQLPLGRAGPRPPQSRGHDGAEADWPGWGVKWSAAGAQAQVDAVPGALQFAMATAVQVSWSVDFRVRPGLRLHVDMGSDDHRLPEVSARVVVEGGQQYDVRLPASQPLRLDRRIPDGVRVRSIVLNFDTRGQAVPWALRGLTVFRPYRLDPEQVGEAPRPGWAEVPLVARPDAAEPGHTWRSEGPRAVAAIRSAPASGDMHRLQWTTDADVPARQLLELRLQYELQGTAAEGCWLQADIRGSHGHHAERTFCPRDGLLHEGVAADMLKHFDEDERIVSVHWTASLYVDQPTEASFRPALGVGVRPSARRALAQGPVLRMEGAPMVPLSMPVPVQDALLQGRRPVWVDYGPLRIQERQEMVPALLQDDGLFELKRVTLVSDQDLRSEAVSRWREMLRPAAPAPGMGKLHKLGFAMLAGVALWLAWRVLARRAHAWLRLLRPVAERARRLCGAAWLACERARSVLARHLPLLHFAVMALALPLFWKAGRGGPGAPWLLGAGVSLFVTSALHLLRGLPPWGRFFVHCLWPFSWFAWFAWALGAYDAPSSPLVAVALLAGCFWPVAFAVHRALWWMKRGMGLLAGVLVVVGLACYGIGFIGAVDGGENVFITLGGLGMIAAWGCLVWSARDPLATWKPWLARWLYGERGGVFLAGALLALPGSAVLLALGMSQVAAHVATLFFYQLCLGAALQASVHWWRKGA